MNRENGFTFIELMITLMIAAIILTIGVPSFQSTIKNNRLITQANMLVSSIGLARSEAVKHARTATVCVSSDQATCTGETNWELGWLVWVDVNGDAILDAGEERRLVEPLPPSMTFASPVSVVTFNSQGAANAATTLDLCDDRSGEIGRRIAVSNTGRPNTSDFNGCV